MSLNMSLAPRGLTVENAAAYAGCRTVSAFRDRVRRGILPGPIPGTHSWDRKAIDAALDKASGLTQGRAATELDHWISRHADRA